MPFVPGACQVCYALRMSTPPWTSRITGYGTVDVDTILANERNWRIHPRAQQEALQAVLAGVGIIQNLIINQRLGEAWPAGDRYVETLIDGACRVMLAHRAGQTTLPVTYVDLDPTEEYTALATFDTLGAVAGTDTDLFQALLHDLPPQAPAVTALFAALLEDTTAGPTLAQASGVSHEVCCPTCGTCFTPERR